MAKKAITWHQECLDNAKAFHRSERKHLEEALNALQRSEAEDVFYAEQIAEAKRRGWTEFDPDRLLKKRATFIETMKADKA